MFKFAKQNCSFPYKFNLYILAIEDTKTYRAPQLPCAVSDTTLPQGNIVHNISLVKYFAQIHIEEYVTVIVQRNIVHHIHVIS